MCTIWRGNAVGRVKERGHLAKLGWRIRKDSFRNERQQCLNKKLVVYPAKDLAWGPLGKRGHHFTNSHVVSDEIFQYTYKLNSAISKSACLCNLNNIDLNGISV